MLVLKRSLGEKLRVILPSGETVAIVTVTKIQRGSINLGIDAERSIKILREEVYQRDLEELKDKGDAA